MQPVPQDPNDEPASELLQRIAAENEKLIAAKGIRSQREAAMAAFAKSWRRE
jgi:type I restriction enzyme S subunit